MVGSTNRYCWVRMEMDNDKVTEPKSFSKLVPGQRRACFSQQADAGDTESALVRHGPHGGPTTDTNTTQPSTPLLGQDGT